MGNVVLDSRADYPTRFKLQYLTAPFLPRFKKESANSSRFKYFNFIKEIPARVLTKTFLYSRSTQMKYLSLLSFKAYIIQLLRASNERP